MARGDAVERVDPGGAAEGCGTRVGIGGDERERGITCIHAGLLDGAAVRIERGLEADGSLADVERRSVTVLASCWERALRSALESLAGSFSRRAASSRTIPAALKLASRAEADSRSGVGGMVPSW